MWWKKYEHILERKPVPAREVLIDLLAKELCEVVSAFPPEEAEIEWGDATLQKRFAGRLNELPAIDLASGTVLAELLTLDLTHEAEAIDHFLRNDKHRDACPSANHVDALTLLWRATLEHLYVRKEETGAVLKTKDLVDIVARFKRRFTLEKTAIQ